MLTDVTTDMVITKEETFKSEEDAVTNSRLAAERTIRGLAGI